MFFIARLNEKFIRYLDYGKYSESALCNKVMDMQWFAFSVEVVKIWYRGTYHTRTGARWCEKDDVLFFIGSELHNRYGPARITAAGDEIWFWHDQIHREDGPAVLVLRGDAVREEWHKNGRRHRERGAAVTLRDKSGAIIDREYWFNGIRCSPELHNYFLIFDNTTSIDSGV
jgi:hypothetical protein